MKKLLILLFSLIILPLSVNASDVYYCSEDAAIGFVPSENYKKSTFNEEKFKMSIDFENKKVIFIELSSIWIQKLRGFPKKTKIELYFSKLHEFVIFVRHTSNPNPSWQ